ncbi:MAG: hypothetical protein ACJAUR_001471 [Ulvibacter sp.]|jgi:hypothetical protein
MVIYFRTRHDPLSLGRFLEVSALYNEIVTFSVKGKTRTL